MKKILITVAILVLLYPAVTWLMGFAIEGRMERLSDQGQQMMPALHPHPEDPARHYHLRRGL